MTTQEDGVAPQMSALRAGKEIAFGSAAGMVSKVFEHPFDLTKVRLQSQVLDASARFSGPVDCLVQTWQKEGMSGLYRGLPAPVVGAMAENASLFLSYRQIQNIMYRYSGTSRSESLSFGQLALAGAGAGGITSFILTPVELVKCKMQVQMLSPTRVGKPPGPISVFLNVVRTNGFRGLWLGHTGTFLRETGGGAAWFGTKEVAASLLVSKSTNPQRSTSELKAWESAAAGACAGAMFNLALFPADTVKSSIQTQEELHGPGRSEGFLKTLVKMYRKQGVKGLYAGCGVTVARSIPSSAMIFVIYDVLNGYFV